MLSSLLLSRESRRRLVDQTRDSGFGEILRPGGSRSWTCLAKHRSNRIRGVGSAPRMIGDAVVQAETSGRAGRDHRAEREAFAVLDNLHHLAQTRTGPSLDEFLARYQLQWPDVRTRYGATALDWHPYGGNETIVDLLEDLRVQTNNNIRNPSYWFRWDYVDLTNDSLQRDRRICTISPPSLVVDPVSLFNVPCANAFKTLERYLREEQSIMACSPLRQEGVDWFAQAIKEQAVPVLNDYFEPSIPPWEASLSAPSTFPVLRTLSALSAAGSGIFISP